LFGLGRHVLAAAKSDLKADVIDIIEQRTQIGRRRRTQIDCKLGEQ
jgi:hypothetical protein